MRRRLTARGSMFLCFSIATLLLLPGIRYNVAYIVFTLFTAPLIVSLIICHCSKLQLTAVRQLPKYCTVGVPAIYNIMVSNTGKTTIRNLEVREIFAEVENAAGNSGTNGTRFRRWFEMLQWRLGASCGHSICDSPLQPGKSVSVKMHLTSMRRGIISPQTIALLQADPLGLCNTITMVAVSDKTLSLPRRYGFPPPVDDGGSSLGLVHRSKQKISSDNEFVYLRDYVPGEPVRHMHWPSLAKCDTPTVRQFTSAYPQCRAVLLDTSDTTHFEQMVSVAASLLAPVDTRQEPAGNVLIAGEKMVSFNQASRRNDEAMLATLATVQAGDNGSLPDLENEALKIAATAEQMLLICSVWDSSRAALCQKLGNKCGQVRVLHVGTAASATAAATDGAPLRHLDADDIAAAMAAMQI